MASINQLEGKWVSDLSRWAEVDPKAGSLPPELMEQMLGDINVTFSGAGFTFIGYRKEQKFEFELRETKGETLVLACQRTEPSPGPCVYEITFIDDNHVNMNLTEPKPDAMALKRA